MNSRRNSIKKFPIEKEIIHPMNQSLSRTNIDEETPQGEDCFQNFGIVSSLHKRSSKTELEEDETDQDQPAKLTEHINAVISLLIYHTYSRKHQSKSTRRIHVSFNHLKLNYGRDSL